ncbi:MAG: ABC transporter permease [Gammaproteobacteria bacterium]|nr:ABC transporter permease [Gammaproteobacteria bacterium]
MKAKTHKSLRILAHWPIAIIICWCLFALLGPLLPLQPNEIDLTRILLPPGEASVLGYDDLGRPIFDRVILGAKTSFLVSLWVVIVSLLIGVTLGIVSAYYGGWFDHVVVQIIDIFLAFPGILLAIALAGIMGPGIENVVIALSTVGWVGYARLTRAQVLSVKQREHIQAAVALGSQSTSIFYKHILPLILAPIIVEASFGIAGIVIAEAGLSFLGLGVQPPEASWGNMIRDGARYLLVAPHMVLVPGIVLMLVVLAVNLAGDRLRDYFDVRLRSSV